jgi:signal transduction histidine kinase
MSERRRAEEALMVTQAQLNASLNQLRALTGRLQGIREEERTRVAREIHDDLGQSLTSIKLDLASLLRTVQPAATIESILRQVDQTIQSVRRIATELRPSILDDLGLVAAVEWAGEEFAARSGIKLWLDLPREDLVIDQEIATAIFRIFQETLTNVARQADASEVEVHLGKDDDSIVLEVRDNGRGMNEELATGGSLGILGMRERALLHNGKLTLQSTAGIGTTVTVRIPTKEGDTR